MPSNILVYNLGELSLDIDLRNMTSEDNPSIIHNPSKIEMSPSTVESTELARPHCWVPELNPKYLEFDETFEEQYLLENKDFGEIQRKKLTYFFEGKFGV